MILGASGASLLLGVQHRFQMKICDGRVRPDSDCPRDLALRLRPPEPGAVKGTKFIAPNRIVRLLCDGGLQMAERQPCFAAGASARAQASSRFGAGR